MNIMSSMDTQQRQAVVSVEREVRPTGHGRATAQARYFNRFFSFLPPLLLGIFFLLAWYFVTASGRVNTFVLPGPADVFASLSSGLSSGILLQNALVTIQESLLGFIFAVVIALPLGYGIAKSRLLALTLQPYLAAGQAVPAVVIAPFLYLWLGIGTPSVLFVCMLIVLFPMVVNTVFGVQSIERDLLEAARLEGAGGWAMLAHIEFPLALPAVLAAVRTGLTLSVAGAIVGEFFCNPDHGLGALVNIALHEYNMAFMFATVILLALLAALYYSATWLLVKLAQAIY